LYILYTIVVLPRDDIRPDKGQARSTGINSGGTGGTNWNPLEFGDEIWRQKTRVLGLPDGEEIMPLAFFVLTIPARDRQTR